MNPDNSLNWTLARLIVVQVCIHACMAGVRMAAPLLALRQGESPAAVGILLALFALTQLFLSLPAGRYADRHSLQRPVALSVGVTVLGVGMAAIWPVFPVLCVTALLCGGATGCAVIALQRHVGRMGKDKTQLKQIFSWLAIAPSVSNFLGPFSAGLLIDHAGFRTAFAVMAVLPLASWYWVRGTPELPLLKNADGAESSRAWDLLAVPQMRRLLVINWMLSSCWDVHTFVVPLLGHERGLSASVIGTILGSFALAAAAIRVLMPFIAERLKEATVLCTAMLITAMLFAVYPLMPTAILLGTCSVLLGLALGSVQPMIMSMLHQLTPPARHGEALGLRLMAINGSSVLMPVIFGYAGALVGVAGLFWIVGAAVGSGSRIAWKMRSMELPEQPH